MKQTEIIEKLKRIIKPYVTDQNAYENVTENTGFITDLKINSANLVDIILDVEEVFGVTIDNESMERMLDIKSALTIIETKLSEK